MKAIWPDSFVEEANLTVWISVLRKALGDREGGSRYIETVPKKGYRFTARVEEATDPGALENRKPIHGLDVTSSVKQSVAGMASAPVREVGGTEAALEGSTSDQRLARGAEPKMRNKWFGVFLLAALVGVLATIGYRGYSRMFRHAPVSARTLAILPLQNLRQDAESDFLGFSLVDAVITKLDYVSSLTVRPSSAVEKYRGKVIDIQSVATDLKVDTLLTGSFLRDGRDLRITYQLIDVKTEKFLGRGTIDLKYDNLLKVQDAVAQQIIQKLELNLSPAEAERIKPEAPVNPLAYEYYLRGVDLYGQHKFPLAIKMLEKSTEIDPNYPLAWAYLGASYTSDAAFELGGSEQYRHAQAAYERALAMQPSQLDAQMFLANLLVDTGKVEQAVPLLRHAVKVNANYAPVHWELGYAYRFAGMLNESVAECERARQIDPLVKSNGSVLNSYLYLGQYEKFLRSLPEVDDSSFLLFYRGLGEYYQRNLEKASKDFERSYEVDPTLYSKIGKALRASISHKESDGLEILRSLESKITERGVGDPEGTYKIAQAYAVLGDKASALRILRQSIEAGFFCYPYVATDPLLNSVRMEPEFNPILEMAHRRHEAFKQSFFQTQSLGGGLGAHQMDSSIDLVKH